MIISINNPAISFNSKDQIFVAELSDIEKTRFEITQLCYKASPIYVRNEKTGKQIKMTLFKVDKDGSGEDTYGWWYRGFNQENGKSFKFLFIND
jgi:hypothetical protein